MGKLDGKVALISGGARGQGAAEATEEAIYNSLFRATTERANGNVVEAIPLDRVMQVLRSRGAVR